MAPAGIQGLIDLFFQSLVSPQIDFSLKQHLILIFESLLLVYQTNEQNADALRLFFETIFDQASQYVSNPSTDVIKGALLICQASLQNIRS